MKIVRDGNIGGFDSVPYLASLLNCALWVSYSVLTPDRLSPLLTNAAGVVLQMTWCGLFLYFSERKGPLVIKLVAIAAFWFAATFVDCEFVPYLHIKPLHRSETLKTEALGTLCALFNIVMYASPLAVARKVIASRSVESMPLPLSVMTFLCCLLWFSYSLLVGDSWIFVPNVCGLVLGIVQLVLYTYYCKRRPRPASTRDMPLTSDC